MLERDCTKNQRIKRGYKGTKRVSRSGESDLNRSRGGEKFGEVERRMQQITRDEV